MVRLRIKELAEQRKWNQKKLAEESGVSVFLLNRYWNNNISRVELDKIERIADALGVAPGDLLEKV